MKQLLLCTQIDCVKKIVLIVFVRSWHNCEQRSIFRSLKRNISHVHGEKFSGFSDTSRNTLLHDVIILYYHNTATRHVFAQRRFVLCRRFKENRLCTEITFYARFVVYLYFILYYIGVPATPRWWYLSEYTRVFMIWPFWWWRGLHTHNPSLKLEHWRCIYTLTYTVVVNKGIQEKTVFRKFGPYVI